MDNLHELIFKRKVQVIETAEGEILFNFKQLLVIFTKITRAYINKKYKHKASQLTLKDGDLFLKKSECFLTERGVRCLISKSKETNWEEIEDFFLDEMRRIKFLGTVNSDESIFDLLQFDYNELPDAIYKKKKIPKSKSSKRIIPRKVLKMLNIREVDHTPSTSLNIPTSPGVDTVDQDNEPTPTVASRSTHEASSNSTIYMIITKNEYSNEVTNKYKIREGTSETVKKVLSKGYRIIHKTEHNIYDTLTTIMPIINELRDVLMLYDDNIKIRNPLSEENLVKHIIEAETEDDE